MKIIDFHAHAFPEKIADPAAMQLESHYKLTVARKATFKELMASADEVGVDRLCLHMAATTPTQVEVANTWIGSHLSERVIGFGSLHVDYDNFIKELDRMESLGISGVKLHPDFQGFAIDDPRMWPIYEAIGDRFMVMFHVGDKVSDLSSPKRLTKVLRDFPNMLMIAAHLGGYSKWDEAEKLLLGKNLWIDTSSTSWGLSREEKARIIRCHDGEKVLFGTDYPIVSHKSELEDFDQIPLTISEKENILGLNAEKLLALAADRRSKTK